ncbi:MAG: MBL fold metallo-hydrolase [Dehalococcoidia bacterium]|nr:MBL fold metallo-hydrolase [Dehalococcoidia bacterium]
MGHGGPQKERPAPNSRGLTRTVRRGRRATEQSRQGLFDQPPLAGAKANPMGSGININVISDGSFLLDGGPVFGAVPKILWENHSKPDRKNRVRLGLNCLLIRTPTANILVDAGIGNKSPEFTKDIYGHTTSKLVRNLRALGLSPRDINFVVLTHLHFDHCGGATRLDREGNIVPTFPKARYLVQRKAWEEGCSPNERAYPVYAHGPAELDVIKQRGQLDLLDGDVELAPGVRAIVTNGHADGHQLITVNSGSERLVFLADLVPTPHHLPLPYITAFDRYPDQTLSAKREMLARTEKEGWLMVFAHGLVERAGYIERRGKVLALKPVAI